MKNVLLLFIACIFATSCGNSKKDSSETQGKAVEKISASSPCEFVSQEKIKEILAIPSDAPTEVKDEMRTYPSCFYKWETVNFSTKTTIGGRELSLEYPAEATLVLVKDATEAMFNTATKVYKDGETQDGVGEMAVWGEKMSQLSFFAKGTMIHLNVKVSGDAAANKAKALELASLIIAKLG